MKTNKWFLAGFLFMIGIGLNAVTRIVDAAGAGQYSSIQTAITACSQGDTVLVYPGTYYENITIQTNGISLISLEAITGAAEYIDSTIINGWYLDCGIRVRQYYQNITIRGFSITQCICGIAVGTDASATVQNCKIFQNEGYYGGGFSAHRCTVFLSGVKIFENNAYELGGGMFMSGDMGTLNVTFDPINRCSIYNNTAGCGQDIVAHSINNDLTIPLHMFTVPNPTSYYAVSSRVSGNECQLLIDAETAHHQEVNSDLYVSPIGLDTNDGLSPARPLKTIKTAIYRIASDSLNQKTVHILPGVYSRTANQQVFPIQLKSWVNVKGAGIAQTQIVGEMEPLYDDPQNSPLNVFTNFYQTHASLEDLSITTAVTNKSCAIWGYKEESLCLKNLRIHNVDPGPANIDFLYATNCLWDGLIIEDFTTPLNGLRVSGCLTGVLRNSIFRNATSNFFHAELSAEPLISVVLGDRFVLENTIFDDFTMADDNTQAIQFVGMYNPPYQAQYSIRNCLFANINSNVRGVNFYCAGFPLTDITNCTFAGHTGNGEALLVNGDAIITNSIFYNNRPLEIAINRISEMDVPNTLTLNNNLIRNGYDDIRHGPLSTVNYSDTNITGNPCFQGGADINNPLYYSLSAISPCINSGTPDISGLNLPPYDLAGNWRVWDGRIDMGCFEFGSEPWVSIDDPIAPQIPALSLTAYPNPFSIFTTIRVSSLNSENSRTEKINNASITIYNIKGQRVKSIVLNPQKTGEQFTYWDARDADNSICSSGIYFVNLMVNGRKVSTKKLTLIR